LEEYVRHTPTAVTAQPQPHPTCPQAGTGILRRHADEFSYEDFVADFLLPNQPVLIQGTNRSWRASEEWVTADGSVDVDFLREKFGGATVSAMESSREAKAYGGGKCHEMTLREFLDTWWGAESWQKPAGGLTESAPLHLTQPAALYLKDWHFVNEFPAYKAYECPPFFRDDWLNDYHDMLHTDAGEGSSRPSIVTSDYRFVYLGRKGTWTPIHADVLRSYSWSTNIAGRKRWLLLAPEHTHLLMDRFGRDIAPSFNLATQDSDAANRFPNLAQAAELAQEVYQGVDEAIFVPSGWHHSVENVEDTLSINHNWVNPYNIHWGWDLMKREHTDAAAAIEDCRELSTPREFEDMVQRNMAANCGMDYFGLARFISAIALRQIDRLGAQNRGAYVGSVGGEPQTQTILEAFSLHRANLVLRELRLELEECYDITHGAAIGEAEAPSNLGSNSALEGVDQDLGAKLGSVQEADDLVNLLAVLVSKADLTLDHVRKHGGAEFA